MKTCRSIDWRWAAPVILALGTFWLHRGILDAGILGYDSFAVIIASRIRDWGDLVGTFTEELMDGRLVVGTFYRPMTNLSLALDYAIWGLQPFGYQLTSLSLWSGTIPLTYLLVRRLIGRACWLGPLSASLLLALHPSALSVLPYPERRPELLMLVFALAALLVLPSRSVPPSRTRLVMAGCLAACAAASKESGVIAVVLIGVHQLVTLRPGTFRELATSGVRLVVFVAPPTLLLIGARLLAIGGIGGYDIAAQQSMLRKLLIFPPNYIAAVLRSEYSADPLLSVGLPLVAALGGFASLVVVIREARRADVDVAGGLIRLGAVGLVWLAAQLVLSVNSMHFTTRYVLAMTVPAVMLFAVAAEGAWTLWRLGDARGRRLAALVGAWCCVSATLALEGSPLFRPYPELARASRIHRQLLVALEQRIQSASPHDYIKLELPRRVVVDSRVVDNFWIISHWGLQAWLDMRFEERPYHVVLERRDGVDHAEYAAVTLQPRE